MPRRASLPLSCSLPLAALALAATCLAPTRAEANEDTMHGTRGREAMVEREHAIAMTFDRGHATLVVRRTIHNSLDQHDEAQFWLSVPEGAVATGVRTLASVDGEPHWYEGELLEAELAAARYQELTGLGGFHPKDPVLLSWRDPTLLALQVFPVEPEADKTIEYTLSMPARWEAGRWVIELPPLGTATLAAELTLKQANSRDQLLVDGGLVTREHQIELDDAVRIELAPRDPEPVTLALASVDIGARHMVELDVSLAAKISELPKRARIVVALDLSRSLSDRMIEAERQAALAYLEHFRDPALAAKVAVIGFDREVHDLSGGFVDVTTAIDTLTDASLTRRNGSDLAVVLEHAGALLAKHAPAGTPRRIVLMTDFMTAWRLTPESLGPIVDRSKAIVHLAQVEDGSPSLYRLDDHEWAGVAARSGGVLWGMRVPTWVYPSDVDSLITTLEEWARPVRIDDFAVQVEGANRGFVGEFAEFGSPSFSESLAEGEGTSVLGFSSTAARKLRVSGRTWNTPFEQTEGLSEDHGDRWSAWVFGSDLLYELSEAEMMVLAMRGRAVSPVTSYLAIEPGVRPSTAGLEPWERAMGNTGLIGKGGGGGSSAHVITPSFDHHAWLRAALTEAWRRCGAAGQPATIALETTLDELVEVDLQLRGSDAAVEQCMRQSIWSLELPAEFHGHFEVWSFHLG